MFLLLCYVLPAALLVDSFRTVRVLDFKKDFVPILGNAAVEIRGLGEFTHDGSILSNIESELSHDREMVREERRNRIMGSTHAFENDYRRTTSRN